MWCRLMVNEKWNLKSYFIYFFKNSHLMGYVQKLKISNLQNWEKKTQFEEEKQELEQEWS